jgi:hypothetical protein
MRNKSFFVALSIVVVAGSQVACSDEAAVKSASMTGGNYGGYESPQKWGEHLVTVSACHDCHSPKIMTPHGPDIDSSRLLSGHPSQAPDPVVDRKDLESKGLIATVDLTTWVGPWGVSYTANLTSDSTGIGMWDEARFLYAIREGKLKGLPNARPLLPPMPWQMYRNMSDEELKAIFAYLKSTKPIHNVVPPPKPPVVMQQP